MLATRGSATIIFQPSLQRGVAAVFWVAVRCECTRYRGQAAPKHELSVFKGLKRPLRRCAHRDYGGVFAVLALYHEAISIACSTAGETA